MNEREPKIMHEVDTLTTFKHASLDHLAQQLPLCSFPNYPVLADRLWADGRLQFLDTGSLILPHGPWDLSAGSVPTIQEQEHFRHSTYGVDFYGRPLHPWFNDMLHHPNVGVVTGKGFYRKWGPNYTADSIIIRHDLEEPQILLVTRADTGLLALPGGFIDPGEDALTAAVRETYEETSLDINDLSSAARFVYQGPLADPRLTANAWPETTAYRFDLERVPAAIQAGDDADKTDWYPLSGLQEVMFGSHRLLIDLALAATAPGQFKNELIGGHHRAALNQGG